MPNKALHPTAYSLGCARSSLGTPTALGRVGVLDDIGGAMARSTHQGRSRRCYLKTIARSRDRESKSLAVNLSEYTKTLRGYFLSWADKQMDNGT
ncbi:MAG: hypothetical protein V7L29_13255 [Nostoc sp.]|uniref:hypothetical protein n=1 Tax=Nostoc sp. TaxID=1180 RepID=UPI002FFC8C7B